MKNCLIMGFGRSGTSLMGGILHQAGYFMGDNLYPPRDSNPKGFFECELINSINERILEEYDFYKNNETFKFYNKEYSPLNPGNSHRWLTYVSSDKDVIFCNDEITNKIKQSISNQPFAFKDPRFNYTLKIWGKFLENETVYICLFREPGITISSVLKECLNNDYLSNFYIDHKLAEYIWINSYIHLLKNYISEKKRFIFIHYKQLIDKSIFGQLSEFLDVELNTDFVSQELNRTAIEYPISKNTNLVYKELCKLASFEIEI